MDEDPPDQPPRRRRELQKRVPGATNPPAPRLTTPPTGPVGPIDPGDIADLKIAPGDPFIRAAYDRTNRATSNLKGTAQGESTDSLAIHRQAKKASSLTFTVQGTLWKAGFAKDFIQTPPGQVAQENTLTPRAGQDPSQIVIREADPAYELVFRELVPKALLAAADRMYGLVSVLQGVYLYYFPRDEGATTGILAAYGDGNASRRHLLYLQTNIRHASPLILDQMEKTFASAIPKAKSNQKGVDMDFWKEFERSVYQVKATFHGSKIRQEGLKVKTQLTSSLKEAGNRVDEVVRRTSVFEEYLPIIASAPIRMLLGAVQGLANLLVKLIGLADRGMKP